MAGVCYPNVVLKCSLTGQNDGVKACHFNACSMKNKMYDIKRIICGTKLNVVCVTESWLSECDASRSINLPGFSSFRHDRPTRGGGLVVYVKKKFKARVLIRSSVNGIEFMFVEIRYK